MSAGTKPEEVKDQDIRWFGVIMLVGLALIGLVLYRRAVKAGEAAGALPVILLCIGAAICAATSVAPVRMRPLYAAWMLLGKSIGLVVGTVILLIVFYGLMTPMSIIMRFARPDRLERAFDPDAKTYWHEREPHPDKRRYYRQF